MIMSPVIFREYDIRGIYNGEFDKTFAYHLGRAFVTLARNKTGVEKPKLTIGHDARLSSPEIVESLSEGFRASGADVILLGMVTSPISYFSTFTLPGVQGGIMVTGSHNPPDYNGFKISLGRNLEEMSTIHGEEIKQLEKIIAKKDYYEGKGSQTSVDILTPYVERYKKEFSGLKPIPVVLDCGNGAGGVIARRLFEAVGLKPTILFEEPDGRFPNHHPDPTVEKNLTALKEEVKKQKARVGIGFDGDADRIGIVDHEGRFILGDEMMALIAQDVLQSLPGSKIVGDVKCSDRMYDFIARRGGIPVMSQTGHSLIKDRVRKEKSPFGGELSGHIFFKDRNYGYDDALYAGLRVIEILSKTGKTVGELLNDLAPSFCTPEIRIDTTEELKHQVVTKIKEAFGKPSSDFKVNLIDGIRVSFSDGWALARASNTQPVLVLRFEAWNESALARIQSQFKEIIGKMIPLPF